MQAPQDSKPTWVPVSVIQFRRFRTNPKCATSAEIHAAWHNKHEINLISGDVRLVIETPKMNDEISHRREHSLGQTMMNCWNSGDSFKGSAWYWMQALEDGQDELIDMIGQLRHDPSPETCARAALLVQAVVNARHDQPTKPLALVGETNE